MKYYIYLVIAIVAAAVIAGFFIVGSPQEERLRRFDERRIQDLQFIQSEIINFWINKGRLPEQLSDMRDDIRGIAIPNDPKTGAEYLYRIKDMHRLVFELCAVFDRSNTVINSSQKFPRVDSYYYSGQNWNHDAGLVCFERTIDKDIYKPAQLR